MKNFILEKLHKYFTSDQDIGPGIADKKNTNIFE